MRIRKRIVRKAISFLAMFLSPEDAKELFEELREIARRHKE
jgi:DNA-directed RNA polymerase subunit F